VIAHLQTIDFIDGSKRKERSRIIKYLTDKKGRMDYPTYLAKGYPSARESSKVRAGTSSVNG
jgi:hypothetical protein